MLVPPRRSIHQGAVFGRVPITWLPPPLCVLRPKYGRVEDLTPRRAEDTGQLRGFRSERGTG